MRVAVIGAKGSAGQRHCAAFQAEGCEVVGLDRGNDWLTEIEGADAVSVATPDDRHADAVVIALASKQHVFCEKPLSHTHGGLDWIENNKRHRPEITFSCNLPLRHSAKLKGLDLYGHVWGQYVWGRPAKWGGWRGDIENYSMVAGGGIHLIDLMLPRGGKLDHAEAVRSGRSIFARLAFNNFTTFDLWLDFESSGDHRVMLATADKIVKFDEPNDFRAPIREFLEDIKAGRPGNGLEAIAANRVCLQIEEAANDALPSP